MSINRVTITGNLTRDPELRATGNGGQVLRLGVAVNDRWFNQQTQQWEDRPNYIDCTVFGKRAGALAQYLHKGQKVAIEGKLRWSSWVDQGTGKNRSKVEVAVDDLEFMNPRGDGQGYGQQGGHNQAQGQYGQPGAYGQQGPYDPSRPVPQAGYGGQQQGRPGPVASMPPAQGPAQGQGMPAPVASVPPQAKVADEDIPF